MLNWHHAAIIFAYYCISWLAAWDTVLLLKVLCFVTDMKRSCILASWHCLLSGTESQQTARGRLWSLFPLWFTCHMVTPMCRNSTPLTLSLWPPTKTITSEWESQQNATFFFLTLTLVCFTVFAFCWNIYRVLMGATQVSNISAQGVFLFLISQPYISTAIYLDQISTVNKKLEGQGWLEKNQTWSVTSVP